MALQYIDEFIHQKAIYVDRVATYHIIDIAGRCIELGDFDRAGELILTYFDSFELPQGSDILKLLMRVGQNAENRSDHHRAEDCFRKMLQFALKLRGKLGPDSRNTAAKVLESYYDRIGRLGKFGVKSAQPIFVLTNRIVATECSEFKLHCEAVDYIVPWSEFVRQERQTNATLIQLKITEEQNSFQEFVSTARKQLSNSHYFANQALIYVHGYNNTLRDAMQRTAMIAFDLDFDGLAIAFSWPSRKGRHVYFGDRDEAVLSANVLLKALSKMSRLFDDIQINIVAHSTGCQLVFEVLRELGARGRKNDVRIREVIFAHADLDKRHLSAEIARISRVCSSITSYYSSADMAIRLSDYVRFNKTRVGRSPTYLTGVDDIDITALSAPLSVNHDNYVESQIAFQDIKRLLLNRTRPPEQRTPEMERIFEKGKGTHWRCIKKL